MTTAELPPIPATIQVAAPAEATPKWAEITITLRHPLTIGERRVTAITLREPDLEALEALEDLNLGAGLKEGEAPKAPTLRQSRAIIRALSREDDAVLLRLNRHDVTTLIEAMTPLLVGEPA